MFKEYESIQQLGYIMKYGTQIYMNTNNATLQNLKVAKRSGIYIKRKICHPNNHITLQTKKFYYVFKSNSNNYIVAFISSTI